MYQFKVYPELDLVVIRLWGEVDFDGIMAVNKEMIAHPDCQSHFRGLADQRGATMLLSSADVDTLAKLNRELGWVKGRWAHLIDAPKPAALAGKYADKAADVHEANIFSTVEAAAAYIGVPDLRKYLLSDDDLGCA